MKFPHFLAKFKHFTVLGLDMFIAVSLYCATIGLIHIESLLSPVFAITSLPMLAGIYFLYFIIFRLYRSLWQYAEIREFAICGGVSVLAGFTYSLLHRFLIQTVPFSVNLLAITLIAISLVSYRFLYRTYRRRKTGNTECPYLSSSCKRVLLVGAGAAGALLVEEIRRNSRSKIFPVGFADDDVQKHKKTIGNVLVFGPVRDIPDICQKMHVDEIYISIPSATLEQRRKILDVCAKTPCPTKILPQFFNHMIRPVNMQENLRDISINDLLNREININRSREILQFIQGKTVLVTGGGGSIGSELCRQIAGGNPEMLIVLDIYENNAYEIQQELRLKYGDELHLAVEIASVRDKNKMESIFSLYRPDLVFHAAAHKHVPLMEHNPEEAVKNNIFGTYYAANLAEEYGVERFVLISTDKAVHPSSFMGATKRFCEKIVQSKNEGATEFVVVRFGNVLGSNGSVVPLFKRQIEAGGPVTVTHRDMERFFMTIPEAVNLVLQAGSMARGGEIFVLNMGDPVKILSLAENMIKMMGYHPYQDIPIAFSGLRPGEKLYEELLLDEEGVVKTGNQRIFCGHPIKVTRAEIEICMDRFRDALQYKNAPALLSLMEEIVPSYGLFRNRGTEPLPDRMENAIGGVEADKRRGAYVGSVVEQIELLG